MSGYLAAIAHGAWTQEWNDHIRTAAQAPIAKGLAEVFVVALQPHLGTDVEEAAQAERGVDDQARCVDARGMGLELQHIIDRVGDIAQIAEDIVDTIFEELRGDGLITLGQWLEGIGVEGIVELEDRSVDRFPGSSSVAAWVAATGASSRLAQTQAWVNRSITPAPILRIDVSPSDLTAAGT